MKAKFVRGQDPKDAMEIGMWKKKAIEEAMKKIAKDYELEFIVSNEDPEYFSAGVTYFGNYYGIGLNPANQKNFEAQFESGSKPNSEEYECDTIEEAIEELERWMDYGEENKGQGSNCPECGSWIDDEEDGCPNCDEEDEEDDISENIKFQRGQEPKEAMGIGTKYKIDKITNYIWEEVKSYAWNDVGVIKPNKYEVRDWVERLEGYMGIEDLMEEDEETLLDSFVDQWIDDNLI